MKSVFTKEAKIGLVTIVSLALLYLGINYLKGINLFQPVNHYYVSFSNVKGVTISSPVFVDGFKVGHDEAARSGWEVFIPRLGFSLDNAGMVAVTGYYKYLAGQFIGLDATPFARTTLE